MTAPIIQGGSFVSSGATQKILLSGGADYFSAVNLTQQAATQNPGRGFEFEWWFGKTAQNAASMRSKTNSTNVVNASVVTSGGFQYFPSPFAASAPLTGTAITAAAPAVASVVNTFNNGDRVRIYGSTGMRQISGMHFTVSSVSGAAVTLLGLDASGFAAPATAFKIVGIDANEPVLPEFLFITGISQATNAVISVSTTHDYVAGMKIRMDIPSVYGMAEMDGLEVTISAVGAYTITLDLDSSSFGAFAFPASAASVNQPRFATLGPSGQRAYFDFISNTQFGYNVTEAPFRSSAPTPFMLLSAGISSPAGSNNDVIVWEALRYSN